MRDQDDPGKLPLPRKWPRHAKAAILNALSLASASFTIHLGRWVNALSPTAKLLAEVERRDAENYRAWCRLHGTKWRYGAAGKKGSIAVVERLIRTIKDEWTRRILVPLSADRFRDDLVVFARWYNGHRPNSGLRGRTPDEVYFGRKPANEAARFEPRKKYPRDAWCASPQAKVKGRRGIGLKLAVSYLDDRRQLPIIKLRPAA